MSSSPLPIAAPILQESEALASRLGFSGFSAGVPGDRSSRWLSEDNRQLVYCGRRLGVELIWSETESTQTKEFERWVLRLARRAPLRRFLHAERNGAGTTTLAMVRPGEFTKRGLCIREAGPEVLSELADLEATNREHFVFRITDVLSREMITGRFFRLFQKHLHCLERSWIHLDRWDDAYTRRDLTLALLCRLMFITFISHTHTLGGKRNFLRWLLERPRSGDIYRTLLQPLFFSVLNTPLENREQDLNGLGLLPFLNGGLFEPLRVERMASTVTLSDELLAKAIHELFETFEFTVKESSQSGPTQAIDPAMLGNVFEALMYSDERHQSGTYYTPTVLVGQLVSEVLIKAADCISPRAGAWVASTLAKQVPPSLDSETQGLLQNKLSKLRILDPAVGSGAFLLGALRALVLLRTRLVRPSDRTALRREIIKQNLYGVDQKVGAVRLCELRLWLSLIADAEGLEQAAPLPNLDHRIRQGDSLSEPFQAGSPSPAGRRCRVAADEGQASSIETGRAESGSRFAELHGTNKDKATAQRHQRELDNLEHLISEENNKLEKALSDLHRIGMSRDLFGELNTLGGDLLRERKRLEASIDLLECARRSVDRGELPFFSYPAAFPEVFRDGGFDVVFGNPPWIRIHDIPPDKRLQYRDRYRFARSGRHSGFSQQFDVSLLFVERGLELVKPDGLVGFLLPSKLFRAQYGRTMRHILSKQHRVHHFADYSLRRERTFSSNCYPAWLLLSPGPPRDGEPVEISLARPDGSSIRSRTRATQLSAPGEPGEPWTGLPADVLRVFARMGDSGVSLSSRGCRARLGVKTGANDVFLTDQWHLKPDEKVALTMADGTELLVNDTLAPQVVRGRDVRPFVASVATRMLAPYDRALVSPLPNPPDNLKGYFLSHMTRLKMRRDSSASTPLWAVFRTNGIAQKPKVVWRDIAPRLEAVFCPVEDCHVPLNTTYFFNVQSSHEGRLLTALLNSTWIRLYATVVAEPAMSGFFRFLAWTVERIPWPIHLRPRGRAANRLVRLTQAAESELTTPIVDEIDEVVAQAYGLTREQQAVLRTLTTVYPTVFAGQHMATRSPEANMSGRPSM